MLRSESMSNLLRPPNFIWRLMRHLNRRVARTYNERGNLPQMVLLLTTIGRKSGLPRVTPLQYEEVDSTIYVAAARGQSADWFRNIVANPQVEVQVGTQRFRAVAEPITDPGRIVDFLETRRARHPRMIGAMLLMHGLLPRADHAQLEKLAAQLALVAIRRCEPGV
jgi:deazaflavin-dependent oxidoreductase (nitroreductase family)